MSISFRKPAAFGTLLFIVAFLPAFAAPLPLDEITVTATKRETTLQDTPITITAFDQQELENAGIEDIAKLADFVPNMVVGQNNNDAQVMIRGIGTSDTVIVSDPSVAVHIDDLYVTRASGLNMLLYDTERVEVLRGPQGTLYGRNATGGSVNIISNKPLDEFGINADALFGDYDWFQFRSALNVPIIKEKLAGRLSLVREKRDGYQKNEFSGGTESNDADALAWRAQLLWTPSDNLSVLFKADDVDFDDVGQQRERLDSPAGNSANLFQDTLADPAKFNSVYKNTPESRNLDSNSQLMRVDWQLNDAMELTFISGWNEMGYDFILDADQWDEPQQTIGYPSMSSDANSQELRLASTTDSPLQWILGLYRLEEDAEQPLLVQNSLELSPSNFVDSVTIKNVWEMKTNSKAIFGRLTYELTDTVRLTGGLRYSDDEKEGRGQQEVCNVFFGNCPIPNTVIEEQNSWDDTTWLAGLDWSPSDNHMFFAKISTGYKAGGFNLISAPPGNTVWDPEEITSYEIGWKASLLDRRLRLNTAAFHYDYEDLQVANIINFSRLTANAAEATINGLELEALYQPADNWMINLSLGWLDAEFDNFIGIDPVNVPQTSAPPGEPEPIPQDFSGNSLTNSPEWSSNLSIQYTFNLGEHGTLTARAQSHWQDDWYLRSYNLPEDKQDSYITSDVRLIWRSPAEYYVEGFVNNINDEQHATSAEVTNGGFFGNINPPRTWGVRVGINY